MNIDFSKAKWLNQPQLFEIKEQFIKIKTEPNTDFWQRSYYGFRNDNAPALLIESKNNFSFTVQTSYEYYRRVFPLGKEELHLRCAPLRR